MNRALHELKALAHETRLHLFAMRKVFQRSGSVPDKIRARFRSRLFLIKTKAGEVALALRDASDLTGPQLMYTRRELGTVRGSIRECDRMLSTPGAGRAAEASVPAENLGWLDLPAGVAGEELPEPASDPELAVTGAPAEGPPESLDFLDALILPGADEPDAPHITGPVTEGPARCPVCGDPDPADRVPCPVCGVRYHRECWEYSGGCAIYGCTPA